MTMTVLGKNDEFHLSLLYVSIYVCVYLHGHGKENSLIVYNAIA